LCYFLNTYRSRFEAKSGQYIEAGIFFDIVSLLDNTYNECTEKDYDQCIFSSMEEKMLEQFGCTVPWVQNKDNICKNKNESKLAENWYLKNRFNQKGICNKNCLFTNVIFGPMLTKPLHDYRGKWVNGSEVKLMFASEIKKTSEYLLYSGLSMLAETGGYLGLLCGVSIVNVSAIFSRLITSIRNISSN
jgi:hypothetical protein